MGYAVSSEPNKIRQRIIENSRKGELYRLKFSDDDRLYEGIPMSGTGMRGERGYFEFRITAPEAARGFRWCHYQDVQRMERRT